MTRNTIETFPARLKQLREGKGMSREALAIAAGTSYHSITKMEQGIRAPSLELAWRVAVALGCTLDDLVQPAEGVVGEVERKRGRPKKQRK